MNIENYHPIKGMDFGKVMRSLYKDCLTGDSFSGMSRQILEEIISEPDLDIIPQYLSWKMFPSGSILWQEGDDDTSLGLIVSGQVTLMKETGFKERRIVVGVYNPVTLVGEISFIDGHPRALTAKAMTDTEMFHLSRESFEKLKKEYPQVGMKIIRGLLHLFATRQRTSFERMIATY